MCEERKRGKGGGLSPQSLHEPGDMQAIGQYAKYINLVESLLKKEIDLLRSESGE